MRFRELSDCEWEFIRPLLPPRARTGSLGLTIGCSERRLVCARYRL